MQTARILEARTEVGLWFDGKCDYIRYSVLLAEKRYLNYIRYNITIDIE